jgi:type I restriction enzyme S subunit
MEREPLPPGWRQATISEIVDPGRPVTYGVVQPGPRHEGGVPIIRGQDYSSGDVATEGLYCVHPSISAAYRRSTVKGGDLLLSIVGYVGLTAEVPDVLSGANLTQTTARVAVRKDNNRRFFLHYFRGERFAAEVSRYTKGSAQPGLNLGDVEKFEVVVPPPEEQRRIAAILDTLDGLIRQTEQVIAKLKEVKQGLLHDLLTRGIDDNGELRPPPDEAPHLYKDSPLGLIPKGWEVLGLAEVAMFITSGSRGWAAFYADSGDLFVRIGNLTRDHINMRFDSRVFVRPPRSSEGQRTAVQPDDLLISITADLGIIAVAPHDLGHAFVNQHIALVRLNQSALRPRWAGHYLAATRGRLQFRRLDDVGAKAGLNLPTVGRLLVVCPSLREQEVIEHNLDHVDERIGRESRHADKLRTLKNGLMDDLLTGRVRVPLPPEEAT